MRQLPLILERGDEAELSADAGGRSCRSLFLQVQYLLHQLYLKQMDVLHLKAPRHPAQDVECAPCQCPRVEDDEHGPMLLCWGLGGFICRRAPPCGQILCSLAVKILAAATQGYRVRIPLVAQMFLGQCGLYVLTRPEQNHVRAWQHPPCGSSR